MKFKIIHYVISIIGITCGAFLFYFLSLVYQPETESESSSINILNECIGFEVVRTTYIIHALKDDINQELATQIACHVNFFGRYYGVDPDLLVAKIKAESDFDPYAENSTSGAKGLMQIMPNVWLEIFGFEEADLFNPWKNIKIGTFVYRHYLDFFGDPDIALVAYWGGPERAMRDIRLGIIEENYHLQKVKKYLAQIKEM